MKNIIVGLIYLSYTFKITDAAIVPKDKTYEVMLNEENFPIEWVYDHEESMFFVTWLFKNSTSPTETTVMTQLSGAQAQPVTGYDISHDQNGTIQLQKITNESIGIYYCRVSYTGASGIPLVTGTATVKLQEAIPTTENLTSTSTTTSTTTTNATFTTKISTVVNTSSSNESTVIIVSSVLGGLFLIGIVITIVLMLLSQRRGHHPARNHRHRDQDQRHKRRDNHRYPSWQDHGQYNNASYMEYTGMGTKMNPLYVPNRSAAHRAEQNYYLGHPSSDHQIYPRNHQIYYGGYNSNVRQQTNMHSYQQRYYGRRGGNTLPRDENNYVAPDYDLYW